MKSNKFWLTLFGVLIVASAIAIFFMSMPQMTYAQIFRDGELIETINLSTLTEAIDIALESEGRRNVIQAENGKIRISEANCFFELCTRKGWRNTGVMPIVCLPNRVSVRLTGGAQTDIDGVVG